MADYINREVLKNDIATNTEPFNTASVFRAINRQIAADVAPVVHAHWQPYEDTVQCSACGFGLFMDGYFFDHGECIHANDRSFRFSFCPNCGAKMDEKEDTQ